MLLTKSKIYEERLFYSCDNDLQDFHPSFTVNIKLSSASKKNYRKFMKYYILKGADYWFWALYSAVKGHHLSLVDIICKRIDRKKHDFLHFCHSHQMYFPISVSSYFMIMFNVSECRLFLCWSIDKPTPKISEFLKEA